MYLLQTIAVMIASRRGTIPAPEPGTFDLGKARVPVAVVAAICFTLVCAALIFLPQFAGNGYVFLGLIVLADALGAAPGCASGWPPARPDRTTPRPTSPETR